MAKPEWGVKRLCQSCATKFYDLGRSPIACPQCGARFDPEALLKSRRSRPAAAPKPAKAPAKAPEVDETGRPDDESPDESSVQPGGDAQTPKDISDDEDDDDDSVIGDTSELGGGADLSDVAVTGADEDN